MLVILEGQDRHAISVRGKRVEVELSPGDALFFAPLCWSIPFFDRPAKALGVVFHSHCVRLLQIFLDGRYPQVLPTPWFYHTALPIGPAGQMVIRALSALAEEGDSRAPARALLVALLACVRQHLVDDVPTFAAQGSAVLTWYRVQTHLHEHFDKAISRESVAEALALHPNYLSALSRQVAGQSFRDVLTALRLNHARHLLRESDLKVDRIAKLCGYRDATRLGKIFRRTIGVTPGQFRQQEPRTH